MIARIGRSEQRHAVKQPQVKTAGHDPAWMIMILASAMRHSVGRPATGMEGGTDLWSGSASRRLNCF